MEQKRFENIDIERNKELFEYEMTEVILNLRGEFAVVSKESMRCDETAVDQQKLQVAPISLPDAECTMPEVAIPATAIGDVRMETPEASETIEIALPSVPDCALDSSAYTKTVPAVTSELSGVALPEMKLDSAKLKPMTLEDEGAKHACGVAVPAVAAVGTVAIRPVSLAPTRKVTLPEIKAAGELLTVEKDSSAAKTSSGDLIASKMEQCERLAAKKVTLPQNAIPPITIKPIHITLPRKALS